MASFRDRFLTPKVANATTSPSAIVAAGAGAAVGILVGLGPIGAVLGAVGAWAVRVIAAVPKDPNALRVNPRQLSEPWRGLLQGVIDARKRFDDALRGVRPGPLQDRLGELGRRLDVAVAEAARIATAGNTLQQGRGRIDTRAIQAELDTARHYGDAGGNAQVVAALEAQLASAARLDSTIHSSWDRLRLLDARIDEAVTRTVELSVTQAESAEVGGLGGLDTEVDSIVGEMESLRQAIEETSTQSGTGVPGTGLSGTGLPGTDG
ncbi:MAG: hypothetical protein FJW94_09580 [Actinobacteria bacterium]|nr:hypothetical protein [Actinomycetota bacterium]